MNLTSKSNRPEKNKKPCAAALLFGLVTFLVSIPLAASTAPRIERDIPYLGPDRAEQLDAYLPPDTFARPVPAVIFIHGGGWHSGDKADARERNVGKNLSAAGYAVFSINYRLNTRIKDPATGKFRITRFVWPQNLYDCKSALRYLRAESARFGIDPGRIAVMGGSGGARLAQLLGATARHDEFNRHGLYTEQSNAVSCILSFYGNYDIRGTHQFADLPPDEAAAKQAEASAITWIDKHTPPVFITHGAADKTGPVEHSRLLAEHLRQLGVDYWYVEIAGAPHSYHLQPKQMDLRPTVLAFLAKHLGQSVRVLPDPDAS
jgi:acetyl esterase/lipase